MHIERVSNDISNEDDYFNETYCIQVTHFIQFKKFRLTKRENPGDSKKPDYDEKTEIASELTKQYGSQNANVYINFKNKLRFLNRNTEERPWESKRDRTDFICWGSFSAVFRSSFNGEKVAVKRVRADSLTPFDQKVEEILGQLDHPNVIKLLLVTQNGDFRSVIGLIY